MQKVMEREMEAPNSQCEKVSVTVERTGSLVSVQDIVTLLANVIWFCFLAALPSEAGKEHLKYFLSECYLKVYKLLKSSVFVGWLQETLMLQPQLCVIIFLNLDSIWCQLGTMALNSRVIELSKAKQGQKLKNDRRMKQAFRSVFIFIQNVKDKMALKAVFTTVPRITPDDVNPKMQRSKVMRTSDSSSAVMQRTGYGSQGGNGNNSHSPAGNHRAGQNVGLTSTETPKKDPTVLGFFEPGDGCTIKKMFGGLTIGSSEVVPCWNYHAVGLAFTRKNCKF